jgi:hypothetical protein
MDSIDPIASGPPAIPRRGLPPIERLQRVSRGRDRPMEDEQRQRHREPQSSEQTELGGEQRGEDDGEEHCHIDVRA